MLYWGKYFRAMPPSTSFEFPLKVKRGTKFAAFIDWFQMAHQTTNPETGRKRKGNVKAFLLEEMEALLSTGKASNNLLEVAGEFKKASVLTPELQAAKAKLSESEFANLVALMEKAGV